MTWICTDDAREFDNNKYRFSLVLNNCIAFLILKSSDYVCYPNYWLCTFQRFFHLTFVKVFSALILQFQKKTSPAKRKHFVGLIQELLWIAQICTDPFQSAQCLISLVIYFLQEHIGVFDSLFMVVDWDLNSHREKLFLPRFGLSCGYVILAGRIKISQQNVAR